MPPSPAAKPSFRTSSPHVAAANGAPDEAFGQMDKFLGLDATAATGQLTGLALQLRHSREQRCQLKLEEAKFSSWRHDRVSQGDRVFASLQQRAVEMGDWRAPHKRISYCVCHQQSVILGPCDYVVAILTKTSEPDMSNKEGGNPHGTGADIASVCLSLPKCGVGMGLPLHLNVAASLHAGPRPDQVGIGVEVGVVHRVLADATLDIHRALALHPALLPTLLGPFVLFDIAPPPDPPVRKLGPTAAQTRRLSTLFPKRAAPPAPSQGAGRVQQPTAQQYSQQMPGS
ncbi:hypothetical protein QBC40DRAFT_299957 [Triangularia verruculosa]|uniref:Uncharacterized protein n=1 Tax=Triangularia verruculosa TaxID=2587418 RepID=A0AAN7ASC4_9PEZI|nr:hypothetical protein QBC40DRAFT_299957 [Triangularia verruculosa]